MFNVLDELLPILYRGFAPVELDIVWIYARFVQDPPLLSSDTGVDLALVVHHAGVLASWRLASC